MDEERANQRLKAEEEALMNAGKKRKRIILQTNCTKRRLLIYIIIAILDLTYQTSRCGCDSSICAESDDVLRFDLSCWS